jgi:hypothetical protein
MHHFEKSIYLSHLLIPPEVRGAERDNPETAKPSETSSEQAV